MPTPGELGLKNLPELKTEEVLLSVPRRLYYMGASKKPSCWLTRRDGFCELGDMDPLI